MEKEKFQKWFRFSKKERNGMLIFLFILLMFFTIPHFFPEKTISTEKKPPYFADNIAEPLTHPNLFIFDPNTLDKAGWLKLGLKEKTANTILHYCQKGGRFRHPEDIRKIYGLKSEDADRLIPFIQIQQNNLHSDRNISKHSVKVSNIPFPIEINHASWQHFAALPGINDKLAQRIVHYRDAKHGFHSVDDIAKAYGLSKQSFEKIKSLLRCTTVLEETKFDNNSNITQEQTVQLQNPITKKVNINAAVLSEFMQSRKIPKSVAEAIIIYREQHGNYSSVADIKNIAFMNNDLFDKISPYLKTEED
ncbi:helix-hairpin-helix domain-containing protein [Rhizosphaericola mali]|uniref:Helix-hairpin-helix domain-containing protein n=1 Tax=Rhizosphaericola mali TaxID=2545455 RepID=A0A5P2G3C7_9BACT|nr:helix-hairpin-helix domain-containing protein [Rhizosphaericola mali]QES89995.1 hypothetical protein E0W69_015455 [Rhizosphaericola mali]